MLHTSNVTGSKITLHFMCIHICKYIFLHFKPHLKQSLNKTTDEHVLISPAENFSEIRFILIFKKSAYIRSVSVNQEPHKNFSSQHARKETVPVNVWCYPPLGTSGLAIASSAPCNPCKRA